MPSPILNNESRARAFVRQPLHGLARTWDMLGQRWSERKYYSRRREWLLSLYNRVLLRTDAPHLPGREHPCWVHWKGQSFPWLARLGSTDWLVLESLLGCGEYDLCQNVDVPAVSLVLDVGANVGYTVRHWAQQFPAARIVAVEPDSKNLAVCRENAKAARIEQRVEFVEAFVVGRHRPVSIDRTLGAWGYRIREEPSAEQTSVRTITMDELVDAYAKDGDTIFVKMDIEGAEREVFKSTGTWTERIVALVAEIHSPYDIDAALADLDRGGSHLSVADARHDGSYSLLALNRPKDRMPNL